MSEIRTNKTRYKVIFLCCVIIFLFLLVRSWFKMSEHCLEELCSLGTDIKFITTEHNVIYWETSNKKTIAH